MYKNVRVVFDRRKQATKTKVAVIEIVVCIQRERCYFSTGYFINKTQWADGKVVNHPRAVVLNEEQLQKLIKMREESTDLVMNKYMDFFLFQIFTGMAFSDAKNFDYERDVVNENGMTFIEGKRMKTGKKFATPLLPITQKILERNNYHMHIPSNQKYNQFLKGIGLAIGCTFPLTTHIARHTFACTVVLGKGIPKEVLQIMMGHSSIKTTEIYAKMPMQFVSQNINQKIFSVWK